MRVYKCVQRNNTKYIYYGNIYYTWTYWLDFRGKLD